jgi:hypothetical protein
VDQATVSTSDVTRTWTTTTPGAYVSPAGEVRARVAANSRNSSYSCRADYMAFTYEYLEGTSVTIPVAEFRAWPAPEERDRLHQPQAVLRRVAAEPADAGPTLTWAVFRRDHVDGFNVYREDENGVRVHVGEEPTIQIAGDEPIFQYVDAAAAATGATYWIGARSCSGHEGLVGPFLVRPVVEGAALALAATPNPTRHFARFEFSLPREAEARLEVFDLSGRRVATPYSALAPAGPSSLEWALRDETGSRVRPGLYFARLETMGRTIVTRVTVLAE